MGEIIIRDGELNRRFRTEHVGGKIEIDLAGDEPEVLVPEDVSVRKRDRPSDRRPLRW